MVHLKNHFCSIGSQHVHLNLFLLHWSRDSPFAIGFGVTQVPSSWPADRLSREMQYISVHHQAIKKQFCELWINNVTLPFSTTGKHQKVFGSHCFPLGSYGVSHLPNLLPPMMKQWTEICQKSVSRPRGGSRVGCIWFGKLELFQ